MSDLIVFVSSVGVFRRNLTSNTVLPLKDMVLLGKGAEVSDTRDKFYSVLGMNPELFGSDLYVTCSETAPFVFERVTRHLVEKHGTDKEVGVKIQYFAAYINDQSLSWVIDWNQDWATCSVQFGGNG